MNRRFRFVALGAVVALVTGLGFVTQRAEAATVDLGITKTACASPLTATTACAPRQGAVAGGPISWEIVVRRASGSGGPTGFTIADTFPSNVTNVTWTCTGSNGGSCGAPVNGVATTPVNGSGNINLTNSALGGGPSSNIRIVVNATIVNNASTQSCPSTDPACTVSNTATVTKAAADTETITSNNTSTANTEIGTSAELVVSKSCGSGPINPGATRNCTITVQNQGPSNASNVVVTDNLDDRTTLTGTPSGTGWSCGTGDPFTCTPTTPPLTVGTSTITYTVRVADDLGPGEALTNTVTVTSSTLDPTSSNNTATATINTPSCSVGLDFRNSGGVSAQGTSGDDVICGSPGDDSLQGRGGNDVIFGGGGSDSLQGGDGNDTLFGGDGDDTVQGNAGNDSLFGGNGADNIQGGSGTDTADGGVGVEFDSCTAVSVTNCNP